MLQPEVLRKGLHVTMGLTTLSFPWLFDSGWPVILVVLACTAAFIALHARLPLLRRLGEALSHVKRVSVGEFCFVAATGIMFFLAADDPVLYCIPLLLLTLADAAAALVGTAYGRHRYATMWDYKSVEGSAAFFAVGFLCIAVPLAWFTRATDVRCDRRGGARCARGHRARGGDRRRLRQPARAAGRVRGDQGDGLTRAATRKRSKAAGRSSSAALALALALLVLLVAVLADMEAQRSSALGTGRRRARYAAERGSELRLVSARARCPSRAGRRSASARAAAGCARRRTRGDELRGKKIAVALRILRASRAQRIAARHMSAPPSDRAEAA